MIIQWFEHFVDWNIVFGNIDAILWLATGYYFLDMCKGLLKLYVKLFEVL